MLSVGGKHFNKMSNINNFSGVIYGSQDIDFPSHMNFGAYFLETISKSKETDAFINGENGEKMRLSEFVQQIVNVSSSLMRMGVEKGDVVAICSENRPEFLVTTMAAMCSGAVITFLNSAYSKGELIHTMGISKPKYMFMSPKACYTYYEALKDKHDTRKLFIFGEESYRNLSVNNVEKSLFKPVDFQGRTEAAMILYSSGTTGLPKGVQLSHANLITAMKQRMSFKTKSKYLSVAPWSNTVGLLYTFKVVLTGRTCIYLSKFSEENYLKAIEKYKAGFLLMVPPLLVLLAKSPNVIKYDVSSVEVIYCGGAPIEFSVMSEARKTFSNLKYLLQGYGMTEATGAITEETEDAIRQGSVGKVVDGNIVKVVDIETGETLGPNQPGEICVKGLVLFSGYIGKDIKDDSDNEGFYKTGDVAYYDHDGYFYITDRIKELIKYKAWQVAPSELEGIILQHPAVKDVGVVGAPDALAGELPTAFVVKKAGERLTEKDIIDHVKAKVSHWKQLRGGVIFTDEILKTPSGKILRRLLKDRLKKTLSKL